MDRRAAISLMAKSLGIAVAVPTILSSLSACQQSSTEQFEPDQRSLEFLSKKQYQMVSGLADAILPETDIVGASQLNVAKFIDKMLALTMTTTDKKQFVIGAEQFERQLNYHCQVECHTAKIQHYQLLLSLFFSIPLHKQQQIFAQQKLVLEQVPMADIYNYYLYKFLLTTRELTLFGYYTSEYVGENILSYDPIPATYLPCIDINDVGNAWSS